MKKFLVLLALLAVSVGVADAGVVLKRERLVSRSYRATGDVDSMVVRAAGTANATRDTTQAVSLLDLVPPNLGYQNADSDTALAFVLHFQTTNSSSYTAGSDSVYLYAQVSQDGKNWIDVTGGQELLVLENGSSNSFFRRFNQAYGGNVLGQLGVAVSGTAPTNVQWLGWPFARFIVRGDYNGEFEWYITRWREQ